MSGDIDPNYEMNETIAPNTEGLDLSDPFHLEMGNIKANQKKAKEEESEEAKKKRIALLLLKADYLDAYRQHTELGSRRFHAILREAQVISRELNGLENTRTNLDVYQSFVEQESSETGNQPLEGEYIPAEKK